MGGMVQLHILKLQEYVNREKDTKELQQAANNPVQLHPPGIPNRVPLDMVLGAARRHRILTGWGCSKRLQRVNGA